MASENDDAQAGVRRRIPIGMFAMVAADIWSNPKIVTAGPLGALVYIFLLTRNAQRGRLGFFPAVDATPSYVARQLGLAEQAAHDAIRACVDAELVEIHEDSLHLLGWDETWARSSLTETQARMLRKRKMKTEIEKDREKQKQKKKSPDKVRTQSGPSVAPPLDPPMSKEEEVRALKIIQRLHEYTGATFTHRGEREQIVTLLRGKGPIGVTDAQLEALAVYTADSGGLGWLNKCDPEGNHYMRGNLNVACVFSQKHIAKHLCTAISPGAWEPEESDWRHPSTAHPRSVPGI